jgi:phage/plasmid-like protein (TIGR03299 family)
MTIRTWYRNLGTPIASGMTIDEQLKEAGLDWTVELSPIGYGDDLSTEEYLAAYRSDTQEVLSIYGKWRKPFQNRQILETFHTFCEQNDLQIDRIGCLKAGKELFAFTKLPIEIDVKKVGDITETHLMITESHECGRGLQIDLYFNRLVCTNGMTRPVRQRQQIINHVSEYNSDRIAGILTHALATVKDYEKTANGLADVVLSQQEAQMHLIKAFGDPNKPLAEQPKIVQTCLKLFLGEGQGSDLLSAYNTAYGLLESVKEYINWHSPVRGSLETAFSSLCYGSRKQKQEAFIQQLVSVHL